MTTVAINDIFLVALARKQKRFTRHGAKNGVGDGIFSIGKGDVIFFFHARKDIAADVLGGFASWVIVGDDGKIGVKLCDPAHFRALAVVAVAACTEKNGELFRMGTKSGERFFERIGGVRIIDENGDVSCIGQLFSQPP